MTAASSGVLQLSSLQQDSSKQEHLNFLKNTKIEPNIASAKNYTRNSSKKVIQFNFSKKTEYAMYT